MDNLQQAAASPVAETSAYDKAMAAMGIVPTAPKAPPSGSTLLPATATPEQLLDAEAVVGGMIDVHVAVSSLSAMFLMDLENTAEVSAAMDFSASERRRLTMFCGPKVIESWKKLGITEHIGIIIFCTMMGGLEFKKWKLLLAENKRQKGFKQAEQKKAEAEQKIADEKANAEQAKAVIEKAKADELIAKAAVKKGGKK